ncbi:hypothetical protein MP228_009749 [Amoeboaphelidium protococcarum]|nr:hypothetical protein MP228_009749 [Amoeboaphelidium protococcarum]
MSEQESENYVSESAYSFPSEDGFDSMDLEGSDQASVQMANPVDDQCRRFFDNGAIEEPDPRIVSGD